MTTNIVHADDQVRSQHGFIDTRTCDALGRKPRPSLKRRMLLGLERGLWYSGVAGLYARLRRSAGITVLLYHSVADSPHSRFIAPRNRISPTLFAQQMRFIARNRRMLSIDELADIIRDDEQVPAGSVLLTFDDGYLDNLTIAAPILDELKLPAVIYLATSFVEHSRNQWADRLYSGLRYRTRGQLHLNGCASHSNGRDFDLSDPAQCAEAYWVAVSSLLPSSVEQRADQLADLLEQLQPHAEEPRLTLNWDDVRRLRQRHPRFTVGIHTDEHVDLTSCTMDTAHTHIVQSLTDYQRELGEPARHFSFPYGRSSPALQSILSDLGLTSAMAGEGVLDPARDGLYGIPRLEAPHELPLLAYWSSGAHPTLTRRRHDRPRNPR